jgi:MFS family permease
MRENAYPKFRWFVLLTMWIVTSTTSLALISPAPLIGEMIKTMPYLSPGAITGMTMGVFNFFVAIAALVGGAILDRLGFIKVYIGGLILIIAGELLIPVIGATFWGMIFIRLLQGFGTGPVMAAAASLAATYFPLKERSIVTGVQGFSVSFGIATGLALVPKLFDMTGSWQSALAWLAPMGIVGLVMTVIVAFGPKPTVVESEEVRLEGPSKGEMKSALSQPVTWFAVACVVSMSWVFQAFNDLTPGYMALDPPVGLGKGPAGAGLLVGAQASYMIGSILCGFICEKIFKGNPRPVVATGFLLGTIFSLAIKFPFVTGNQTILITALTLAAFFFSFVNPLCMAFIAKNYPQHITGKLGGLAMGIGIFGGTAGVTAGATALHATGLYQMSINIMCGICFIGFLISIGLNPKKIRETSKA